MLKAHACIGSVRSYAVLQLHWHLKNEIMRQYLNVLVPKIVYCRVLKKWVNCLKCYGVHDRPDYCFLVE